MQNNNKKLKRKVRNSYVISTISIALVLFLLGTVGYLIINAMSATDRMKESVAVYVMLKTDANDEQKAVIRENLEKESAIKEMKFVSKDEAATEFIEYIGSDFVAFLEHNPLPDSFELKMKADDTGKEAIAELEQRAMTWEGVDEVVYQKSVVEQIGSNINKFNLILLLFGGTLLVISLILLNNTIRVTIFSKRYIINTMKLVGATRWFIMKPFIKSSILQGIYSGLIAIAMFIGMIAGLNEGLPEIKFMTEQTHLLIIMSVMLVGGILISLLFTTFAVNKFIKMHSNNIHLY